MGVCWECDGTGCDYCLPKALCKECGDECQLDFIDSDGVCIGCYYEKHSEEFTEDEQSICNNCIHVKVCQAVLDRELRNLTNQECMYSENHFIHQVVGSSLKGGENGQI